MKKKEKSETGKQKRLRLPKAKEEKTVMADTYPKAKIKTIKPQLSDKGFHRKFEGKDGKSTMYVFDVTFEGSDLPDGECFSTNANGKFKDGDEVLYTKSEKAKGGWKYSLKVVEDKKAGGAGANKYTYNDPESIKKAAMVGGIELAVELYKNLGLVPKTENVEDPKKILAYGKKFYEWIIKGIETRDDMFNRKGALHSAIKTIEVLPSFRDPKAATGLCMEFAEQILIMVSTCSDVKSE